MEIKIFGSNESGVPLCLGSKVFNISNYAGRIKHKMEIYLNECPLSRNKLHLQITVVPLSESKQITELFLRGEPELG
jgi:hypothetical protein